MEQKGREDSFYKIWEVLKPLIIYYVTCQAALLLIIYLCNAAVEYFGGGLQIYAKEYAGTLTEVISGLSMLIGVLPLIPMLGRELAVRGYNAGEIESDGSVKFKNMSEKRKMNGAISGASALLITVVLAASSSVGVNVLLSLTDLVNLSETYRDVAHQQYSVVFCVGAVLFGLISPIAEEIVFRGLVFNRMRRYYPTVTAIIVSGVLFGVYHGNLVQGVYGGCMGILMAYTYERMQRFFIPCLFHAAANLTAYTLTYVQTLYQGLQRIIFTTAGCMILLIISAVCIFMIERRRNR